MASSTLSVSTIDSAANLFSVASSTGQSYFDIMSGGYVGVGTSTPGYLLSVGSISAASGVVAGFANVDSECIINPTTTSFSCSSDKRLKKNITSISDASALSRVASLSPISYNWNTEASSTLQHTGFIAQEVLPLFPDLVSTTDNGYYAVNYAGFVPYLAGAIRELNGKFSVPAEATTTLSAVLTADGKSVDLYKLATYDLSGISALAAKLDAQDVRITALETRMTALESGAVSSATGSPISLSTSSLASVFEGFSAYIGKGFAQFGSLIADRFVAAKNSAGTSSAGTVTMLTGNTVAQVTNAYVTPATKIFVTFNSQITGSWWVSDKTDGSFRVVLSAAQTADVSFDYFLVQTEGQMATSTPDSLQGSTLNQNSQGHSNSDTVAPVITLLGDNPLHISVGGTFVEPGVSVSDNVDGSDAYITFVNGIQQEASSATITTTSATTYTITYKATDAAGNSATATRTVIVGTPSGDTTNIQGSTLNTNTQGQTLDTVPPVVTLNGSAAIELTVGDTFTDAGATATDDTDGDLTNHIKVSGTVDTATAGSYSLTYSATDAAGNTGSAGRMVTVSTAPAAGATDTTASSTPAI